MRRLLVRRRKAPLHEGHGDAAPHHGGKDDPRTGKDEAVRLARLGRLRDGKHGLLCSCAKTTIKSSKEKEVLVSVCKFDPPYQYGGALRVPFSRQEEVFDLQSHRGRQPRGDCSQGSVAAAAGRVEPRADERANRAVGAADVKGCHDGVVVVGPHGKENVAKELHQSQDGNDDGRASVIVGRPGREDHPSELLWNKVFIVGQEHRH